ncbi:MAG: MBL fold metallo-hydrolase [Hyphomicrobiales bacterium]|nr:MAG: MBL fold metallo-hydrolase [Hyphomicrobiales bacterium]
MSVLSDDPERDWSRPGVYEVDHGLFRVPLPLDQDHLKAVNVYVLRDESGASLVDSGWVVGTSRELLAAALAALDLGLADIKRILVTHLHRDHYTLGVALRREFGLTIDLGSGDRASLAAASVVGRPPLEAQRVQMVRCGSPRLASWIDANAEAETGHDPALWEQPDNWLGSATTVHVGGRVLEALPTPGHTQGHYVFDDAEANIMFTGDHVLPHITPSIGFESVLAASPLRDFLQSLTMLRGRPDRRMLPAHGPTGGSVHERVDALLDHHRARFNQILSLLQARDGAACASEIAGAMNWTRRERRLDELDMFNQVLAVAEIESHLEALVERGELQRKEDAGVQHYTRV